MGDAESNFYAPLEPSTSLCKTGWSILEEFHFSRCFSYGVLLQIPTFLAIIWILPTCISMLRRKQAFTAPVASQKRHRQRFFLQTFLTMALMGALFFNAFSSENRHDIALPGSTALLASASFANSLMVVELNKAAGPSKSLLLYWLSFSFVTLATEKYVLFVLSLAIFMLEWYQPRREPKDSESKNP